MRIVFQELSLIAKRCAEDEVSPAIPYFSLFNGIYPKFCFILAFFIGINLQPHFISAFWMEEILSCKVFQHFQWNKSTAVSNFFVFNKTNLQSCIILAFSMAFYFNGFLFWLFQVVPFLNIFNKINFHRFPYFHLFKRTNPSRTLFWSLQ